MLTKSQKREYINNDGTHCPYCGSDDIEATESFDGDTLSQKCKCNKCERKWRDYYKLVDVIET